MQRAWPRNWKPSTRCKKLDVNPDDAEANFAVGRHELIANGDWSQALPKLAKGSEASWQSLAKDELESVRSPATPTRQLALADDWLTLAQQEPWPGRHYLSMRAAEHYRLAQRSLAGKDQVHASETLRSLLSEDDGLPRWNLFDIDKGRQIGRYVRLTRGGHTHAHQIRWSNRGDV